MKRECEQTMPEQECLDVSIRHELRGTIENQHDRLFGHHMQFMSDVISRPSITPF